MKHRIRYHVMLVLLALFAGQAAAQTYAPGSNEYFITSTYFGVLGRAPDASGWVWWATQANMGTSWLDILADNLNSQEYANKFGSPDNTAFVTLLFQNALLRQPDPGGLAFWTGFLDNSSLTRSQVAEYIITSDEFNTDQTNGTALSVYGTTAATYHSAYAVPATFSLTGNGAAGVEQVLTVNYTDTDGPAFVASGQVIVGSSSGPSGNNTCYILWDSSGNLTLAGDPLYPNNITGRVGGSVMVNSYCSLIALNTTLGVSTDGQTYAAALHVKFNGNQAGNHEVWSSALNTAGLTSGYVPLGALTIQAAAPANLLQPAAGATPKVGDEVTYQMYGYEADNWTSDNALLILQIHPTDGTPVNFASSCSVQYKPATNTVYLVNDTASGVTSGAPGSSVVLWNSQCSVNLLKTSASNSSGNVTVTVPIKFTARYAGPRYDDIALYENQTFNWFYFGTIMISPTVPTAVLLQPTDPATATVGLPVTYQVYGYEPDNWTSDNALLLLDVSRNLGGVGDYASSCYVQYKPAANIVYLVNDLGNGWTSGKPGDAAPLINSQCSVSLSGTSVSANGGNVTITLPITFLTGYAGIRYNYVSPYENTTFAWSPFGTINISQATAYYYLTTSVSPPGAGNIAPASGWYLSGSAVTVSATAAGGYQFSGFSGALSGATNPQSLVVNATESVVANFTAVQSGPTITTTSPLPNGTVYVSYSRAFAATGGTSPYTWYLAGGSLPAGLSLLAGGTLSGTPTVTGNYSFTIRVSDRNSHSASQQFALTIYSATPAITTASLPDASVNTQYSQTFAAAGGTQPYTWSQTSGTLPTGFSLSSSGVLSGRATTSNSYTFKVQVRDSLGRLSTAASFTLNVTAAFAVTSSPPGVSLTVDSVPCTTPCGFQWVSGSVHGGGSRGASGGNRYSVRLRKLVG